MFDLEALLDSSPPLLLIATSLAFGMVLGLTFERSLRSRVKQWRRGVDDLSRAEFNSQVRLLALPFWSAAVAIAIGCGGCIQLFGFQPVAAYGFSTLVAALGGSAVWWQLQSVLERFAAKQFDLP
ncbi:MAG: hypothetical protein AAGB13_02830 [Cyanobacteria bacterium P01_F01_bin.33]